MLPRTSAPPRSDSAIFEQPARYFEVATRRNSLFAESTRSFDERSRATGSNSIRDLLRAHFARLPEMLRALSEFSIIECREDVPALTLTSSGRRESHRVLPRTRAFLLRGTHRRRDRPPRVLCATRERDSADTHRQVRADSARRCYADAADWPRETGARARRTRRAATPRTSTSSGPPSASFTPPDSGAASVEFAAPADRATSPLRQPRQSLPPLSFTSPKTAADAAAAAAALAASNVAWRAEESAQGLHSPRPFAVGKPLPPPPGTPRAAEPPLLVPPLAEPPRHPPPRPPPFAAPRSRRDRHAPRPAAAPPITPPPSTPQPQSPPPLAVLPHRRRVRRPWSRRRPAPLLHALSRRPRRASPTIPPPPARPQTSASSSRAGPPLAASAGPDTSSEPHRHAHKRRHASPLPPNAKRAAETGSSAENPMLIESPERPAAESGNRFSGFAFDEPHAAENSPPPLVIAENEPSTELSASKAAESASRCPTPRLPPFEERELESPRSPSSPPRPAASSSTREISTAFSPRLRVPLRGHRRSSRSTPRTMWQRMRRTLRRSSNNAKTLCVLACAAVISFAHRVE